MNENVFLNEDAMSYYLLGIVASDGHVSNVSRRRFFSISSKDEDWLVQIRDLVDSSRPIHKEVGCSRVYFYNIPIVNWLISKGCTERKSKSILFPDIPTRYRRDFIRGYFEGDGSISVGRYTKIKNGRSYFYKYVVAYICSGSRLFIEQLADVLREEKGINVTARPVSSGGNTLVPTVTETYRVAMSGKTAQKFVDWMYYEEPKVFLPRKYELVKQSRQSD